MGSISIGEYIDLNSPFSYGSACELILRISYSLESLHQNRLLSTLKEADVLVLDNGDLDILPHSPVSDTVIGVIDCVPPELFSCHKRNTSSDIYWLGVLSYEIITGKPPISETSLTKHINSKLSGNIDSPKFVRDDCSDALSNAILKALSSDPNNRQETVREFVNDSKLESQ